MLNGSALATLIRTSMGFPSPNSNQVNGWGAGIVSEVIQGKVNNAPGTVTGVTHIKTGVPNPPLTNGAASNGLISSLSGSRLASAVAADAGYPFVSSILTIYCNQIVGHIQSQGKVSFATNSITGGCTGTISAPGNLAIGAGTNGTISGLDGSLLASNIHSAVGYPGGVSARLTEFCTAITSYIMANAVVTYASGSVIGICPATSSVSALSNGSASNGTIV